MKGQKYNAKKTPCNNGHTHPSKKEAKRCDELHLAQKGGLIRNLEVQPKFVWDINGGPVMMQNGQPMGYVADFQYFEGNRHVVEDSKGMMTPDARIRFNLFRHLFPNTELRIS